MTKYNQANRYVMAIGALLLICSMALITHDPGYASGKSKKGWLGVGIREMTPSMRKEYALGDRFGLLITHVVENSPAEDAGLREGDVIVKYDGKTVEMANDFAKKVRRTAPGTNVELLIVRDGEEKEIAVTIERSKLRRRAPLVWSEGIAISLGRPRLGVRVHDLNEDLAAYFDVEKNSGVLIAEVFEDTPAEEAGLRAGDVITKVDDEKITDEEALVDVLSEYEDGDLATVEYVRKGKTEKVEVELEGSGVHDIQIHDLEPYELPRLRWHLFERDKPRIFFQEFQRRSNSI